jgi:hypothetical protein
MEMGIGQLVKRLIECVSHSDKRIISLGLRERR